MPANIEVSLVFLLVELLSVLVHSRNAQLMAEHIQDAIRVDLVACNVVVANEGLTRLLHF